ncbi:MAG: hypothetical protein NC344_06935 [Bacteroidales bacterium]|nr:hypothetical protein [Bacteroidales bacterium]MCM1147552.1 hypothetical protein [Bacteroidales bacterium]MCM1206342.1 hypothetical protein [Bacillota bacterium]MCM1511229.1 hypothetical protein [Clostridium sp.]
MDFLSFTRLSYFWGKVKSYIDKAIKGVEDKVSQIDLSLFKVVDSLPTADINPDKIYLVLSASKGTNNTYTEYVYVDGKWEIIGEYKAAVDLTPYVKFTDLASASKAGAMSPADKKNLDDLVTKVNNLIATGGEANVLETVKVNGVALAITDKAVNIPLASSTVAGVMSTTDKQKLDGIQEITEAQIDSLFT